MVWKSLAAALLAGALAAPALAQESKSSFTIKPFGRLQYDVGKVDRPEGVTGTGYDWRDEIRRARLGVEGELPASFGYKVELEFAGDRDIEVTDAYLTHQPSKPLRLTLGQHNNFQSMEELTSSRFLSFLERAAFTDAFAFTRRLGVSASWSKGDVVAQAGVFTENVHEFSDPEDGVSVDARFVYAPKRGKTQIHIGGSAHRRDTGGDPLQRYSVRPAVHTVDTRFASTPRLAVEEETSFGLEAAMIRGPFHAVGEINRFEADTATPGRSPAFFGGYAELGWFLTGESRGYKGGRWDRTKVKRPLGKGGAGALQLNLRYDHLDLESGGINGGRQGGYHVSLIWIPHDQVRFLINYAWLRYEDAAIARAGGDRGYGVQVFGARAQVDF